MIKQKLVTFGFTALMACLSHHVNGAVVPSQAEIESQQIKANIKAKQKNLEQLLNDYKDPNCLKKLFFGKDAYEKIYYVFMQCVNDPAKCDSIVLRNNSNPQKFRDLADQIRVANIKLKDHATITAQIADLEQKRAALVQSTK